jgi:hypothetical protein
MEENKKDYYTRAIEEAKEREAFYQQIVEELRTEERYRNYFSGFAPESVERFIAYYATQKVNWYRYSEVHNSYEKRKDEQWYTMALRLFTTIQRKKAYEAIIRWGNYELSISEARSYYDLNKWLCNPFLCPYIEPVQAHEVEMAVRFIHSLGEERLKYLEHSHFSIQTLQLLDEESLELDEYNYPLFFRYWDKEYGTEHLVRKVPERIKKEMAYLSAYREQRKQQQPVAKTEPKQQKPSLAYYDRKIVESFVAACETKEFKRMYKLKKWWSSRSEFSEFVERELEHLSGSPGHLPVESHHDWREAITRTAELYTREQVAECLPLVYQEYLDRLNKGDDFKDWTTEKDITLLPWYPKHLQEILEGRKLMNEPADFNF